MELVRVLEKCFRKGSDDGSMYFIEDRHMLDLDKSTEQRCPSSVAMKAGMASTVWVRRLESRLLLTYEVSKLSQMARASPDRWLWQCSLTFIHFMCASHALV